MCTTIHTYTLTRTQNRAQSIVNKPWPEYFYVFLSAYTHSSLSLSFQLSIIAVIFPPSGLSIVRENKRNRHTVYIPPSYAQCASIIIILIYIRPEYTLCRYVFLGPLTNLSARGDAIYRPYNCSLSMHVPNRGYLISFRRNTIVTLLVILCRRRHYRRRRRRHRAAIQGAIRARDNDVTCYKTIVLPPDSI